MPRSRPSCSNTAPLLQEGNQPSSPSQSNRYNQPQDVQFPMHLHKISRAAKAVFKIKQIADKEMAFETLTLLTQPEAALGAPMSGCTQMAVMSPSRTIHPFLYSGKKVSVLCIEIKQHPCHMLQAACLFVLAPPYAQVSVASLTCLHSVIRTECLKPCAANEVC